MQQATVFRKIENNKYIFKLTEYPETKSYSELIKFEKNNGFRQVIINSEIMIKIIMNVLQNDSFVLRSIVFNDTVDSEYREEIDYKVRGLKKNPLLLTELVTDLSWASEKNSIDIEKIDLAYEVSGEFESVTIICNGVISGTNLNYFFENYLKKSLEESF